MKVASPFEIFWFSDPGTLAHIIITRRIAERAPLTELVAAGPGPGQSLVHFYQVPGGTDVAAAAGPSKDFNDHYFVSTPFILAIRGDPEREKGVRDSDKTSKAQIEASNSGQLVQASL